MFKKIGVVVVVLGYIGSSYSGSFGVGSNVKSELLDAFFERIDICKVNNAPDKLDDLKKYLGYLVDKVVEYRSENGKYDTVFKSWNKSIGQFAFCVTTEELRENLKAVNISGAYFDNLIHMPRIKMKEASQSATGKTMVDMTCMHDPLLGYPIFTHAYYGVWGGQIRDVTDIVKSRLYKDPINGNEAFSLDVEQGKGTMNKIFGDHIPGVVKYFYAEYIYKNGTVVRKAFPENLSVVLPYIATFGFGASESPTQGKPTLVKATYGSEKTVKDVMHIMKEKLANAPYASGKNVINMDDVFGGDPCPGENKTLTLECTYPDGTSITKIYPQNAMFSIS